MYDTMKYNKFTIIEYYEKNIIKTLQITMMTLFHFKLFYNNN